MKFVRFILLALVLALVLALLTGASSSSPFIPGVLTLESFGANGDGLSPTADTAAFAAVVSNLTRAAKLGGATLQLGCGRTYDLGTSGPYTIPTGVTIVGCGESSVLRFSNNNALLIVGGDHVSFLNFKIVGSGSGSNQIGIANQNLGAPANSGYHWMRVDGMVFDSLAGAGVLTFQIPAPVVGTTPYFNSLVSNSRFFRCGIGLWQLAEYSNASNIQVDDCTTGVEAEGGNQAYTGGSITGCNVGFQLDGGGNDAHGFVTGFLINHNTTNLRVWNTMTQGEQFVSDMFYGGDISLTSSHAVVIRSSHIDANNIYLDGSIGTVFDGDTWPNGCCANTIHNSYNGHASTTFATGANVDLSGNPSSIVTGAGWTMNGLTTQYGQFSAGGPPGYFKGVIGPDPGAETAAGTLHLLLSQTTPTSSNWVVQSDANYTILNAPTSTLYLYNGGVSQLAAFSLATNTIGYSDSRAVNTILGSIKTTQRSTGSNFTIDSGGVSDREIYMTGPCTVTLPAPTAGRELEIVIGYDPTAGSGSIARHASELINGAASNLTLGATDKYSVFSVRTNGTDWVIGNATKAP